MKDKANQKHPHSALDDSEIRNDRWNSKLQALADTLLHHVKEREEREKRGSKGLYIDFKQLE